MRIDLLLVDRKCYSYETYALNYVIDQLKQLGILYHLIYLYEECLNNYLVHIQRDPPTWTLSFVNVFPYASLLCDVFGIPHFFWLEGSFVQGIHFLNSLYVKMGVGEALLCQKLNVSNVFFLPLGIPKNQSILKIFDVVLFGDLIALPFLETTWEESLNPIDNVHIKEAIYEKNPLISLPHYFYVEQYLNTQNHQKKVVSFKEVSLHVFGEHAGTDWLVHLPPCIHLHSALPYTEYFEVLKASKMIILSQNSPWYLQAIALNCLPIDSEQEAKFYLKYPAKREESLMQLQNTHDLPSWNRQVNSMIDLMHDSRTRERL